MSAQNAAFQGFYKLPGDHRAKVRSGSPVLTGVKSALNYLERLYPHAIGEVLAGFRHFERGGRVDMTASIVVASATRA